MSILQFFAVLALAAPASAAPIAAVDCGTTDYFVDTYFQKSFTVGSNASCVYQFSWKAQTGAFIAAHGDGLDDGDYRTSAVMYNEFEGGKDVRIGKQEDESYLSDVNTFWAPGTVILSISTGDNSNVVVTLVINVVNSTKDAVVKTTQVITGQQPIVVTDNLVFGNTYVYSSTSKITFSAPAPSDAFNGNATYWDSVLVYDGQGPNAKLVGSLNGLYQTSTYVMESTSITLYPMSTATLAGKFIINNQQNIGAFNSERMFYFFSHQVGRNSSGVLIDSREGPGSTTIVCFGAGDNRPADYPIITGIKFMDNTSVMQVFSGYPTNKMAPNYIKQFTPASVTNMTPQPFAAGTAITFTLTKGHAIISFTSALTPPAMN